MSTLSELRGLEFDWFAVDESGQVALFATAGCGPIPRQILAVAEQHGEISDQIAVEGWGSNAVWRSYAKVGLFAYDWDDQAQGYARVAVPDQSLDAVLSAGTTRLSLPRFPGSFCDRVQFKESDFSEFTDFD